MAFLSDDALQDAQAAWRRLDVSLLSGARPWKEFFEVFKPSSGDLEKRMSTNLLHYKTNYAQIALGVVVLGFLAKPSALLGLALAAATACGLLTAPVSRRFIVVGGARIPINNTSRALAATASAIVVLVLFRVLLWLALISCLALLLPLAHMALRPRTLAAKYVRRADISPMNRGDAAAATWIFRGESRRRCGCDVDIPWRQVAAASRPRRGCSAETSRGGATATMSHVDIPRRRVAAAPRLRRGDFVEMSRGDAAAKTWMLSGNGRAPQVQRGDRRGPVALGLGHWCARPRGSRGGNRRDVCVAGRGRADRAAGAR